MSVDTGLIVQALRARGHAVGHVISVPENAGEYEFEVDGGLVTLEEARALMEADDAGAADDGVRETVVGEAVILEQVAQDVVVVETVPVVVVDKNV